MEISDVELQFVTATREFGTTSAVKETDRSVYGILRVTADDGTTGVGEISDVENPEEAPSAAEVEAEIGSALLGADPREINRIVDETSRSIDFGPFEFHSFQQLVLSAVDTALYDLVGNYYGIPVFQLLGGKTREVPVSWVVYTRQEKGALDALRREVRSQFDRGFRAFKLKVGEVDPSVDAERIRAVREIAGDDARVLVDAQGVWTVEEAIENVRAFEEIGIDGVETPVGHPDQSADAPGYYYDVPLIPSELAAVREAVETPVFEHVLEPDFGLALIAEDAVDGFTAEVCAGGINRADRILTLAESAGLEARLGSTLELGPGTLAAGALGVSSTAVTYPCDLVGPAVLSESTIEDDVEYPDGVLSLPDGPGFGFEVRDGLFEEQ